MRHMRLPLILGLTLFASLAHAEDKSSIQSIVPEGFEQVYDQYHYSPAVRAGDIVILSGVVAALSEDETNDDMSAAFERAFTEIDIILKTADTDWDDVVEIQTFHTELLPQIQAFAAVKDKWLLEPYPAWTAIDIDSLFLERGLVEIKITAYAPK